MSSLSQRVVARFIPDLLPHSGGEQLALLSFGAVLLSVMSLTVMHLPVLVQLVVLISILVVLFFFTRPENSLLVFFGLRAIFDLLWWIPGSVAGLNMLELFTGAVTGLAAVLFVLEFRRIDRHPGLLFFFPFTVVLGIAMARNLELRSGVEILARSVSPLLMMFLVTAFFRDQAKRRQLWLVVSCVMIVPVLVSMFHLASGQMSSYSLSGYNRLLGGYKNLHNHGLMMMLICCIGTWWLLRVPRQQNYRRMAIGGLTGMAALALYFTYIRTGMMGLAAFGIVYLAVTGRKQYLGFALIAATIFVVLSPTMQDRFQDILLVFSSDEVALNKRKLGSGRWGLWSSSFKTYLTYPFGDVMLGLGLGKHWLMTRDFYNPYAAAQQGYVDPHSDYLTVLYQLGPIAMFSYMAMQLQVAWYGLRLTTIGRDSWARDFGGFMVALTATAMLTSAISNAFINRTTLGWYYWGMAGIMFAEYFANLDAWERDGPPVALVDEEDEASEGAAPLAVAGRPSTPRQAAFPSIHIGRRMRRPPRPPSKD